MNHTVWLSFAGVNFVGGSFLVSEALESIVKRHASKSFIVGERNCLRAEINQFNLSKKSPVTRRMRIRLRLSLWLWLKFHPQYQMSYQELISKL